MSKVGHIYLEDKKSYIGLSNVTILDTASDVSTLLETYNYIKGKVDILKIVDVVTDDEDGFYYFVIDKAYSGRRFDILDFINKVYKHQSVNCINVSLLFDSKLSRGVYDDENGSRTDSYEDEQATSYLDESEINYNLENSLVFKRLGTKISITSTGIIIGRSVNKVNLLINDNNNIGRTHCKVYLRGNKVMVHDYDSTNGTFVNGVRVTSDCDVELCKRDVLTLADEEFYLS